MADGDKLPNIHKTIFPNSMTSLQATVYPARDQLTQNLRCLSTMMQGRGKGKN